MVLLRPDRVPPGDAISLEDLSLVTPPFVGAAALVAVGLIALAVARWPLRERVPLS